MYTGLCSPVCFTVYLSGLISRMRPRLSLEAGVSMVTMVLVTMALDTLCEPQTHTEPSSESQQPAPETGAAAAPWSRAKQKSNIQWPVETRQ